MEEQSFALMLRQALTEYDFERIEIAPETARVALRREVLTETSDDGLVEYTFTDPVLVKVLEILKSHLPSL